MKKSILILFISIGAMVGNLWADRLDQMISPVTNPVNFEDPRSQTEIRPIYLYHSLDDNFVTGGGDIQLFAMQLRYAIDERLSVIATKDGYIDFNPNEVLTEEEGFANLAAGLKYAFVHDPSEGRVVSAILRYEAPTGNTDVLQGKGDGEIQPSISAAYAIDDTFTFMGATGFRLALDDDYSSFWNADVHFDAKLGSFYPTIEMNMVHVIDAGTQLPIADEGADLFNFGSSESDGKTLVTAGVGGRYRINDDMDFGMAYQLPLTNGQGSETFEWRITADMIFRFS